MGACADIERAFAYAQSDAHACDAYQVAKVYDDVFRWHSGGSRRDALDISLRLVQVESVTREIICKSEREVPRKEEELFVAWYFLISFKCQELLFC